MAETKTIESFKGEHGDNYEGFIDYKTASEKLDTVTLYLLCERARHTEVIGATTYYRCGVYSDPIGTIVPRVMFEPFWGKLGTDMLTKDEVAEALAEFAVEMDAV